MLPGMCIRSPEQGPMNGDKITRIAEISAAVSRLVAD